MSRLAKLHTDFGEFLDVTLVPSEGGVIIVHPIILAAFSELISTLLLDQPRPQTHAVIFLPDFTFSKVNDSLETILNRGMPGTALSKFLFSQNKSKKDQVGPDNNCINVKPLYSETIPNNEKHKLITSPKKLDNMFTKSNNQNDVKCPYCEKLFTTRKRMLCHLSLIHESRKEYLDFMKEQEDKTWVCKLCTKIFTRSGQCKEHLLLVHELGSIFVCKVCKKKVVGKVNIRAHMITHDKVLSCDVCGKGFSKSEYLKTHFLKVHSSMKEQSLAKKHICSKCPKRFYQANLLLRHEYVHSETNNFSCKICSYSSKTSDAVRSHTNQIHLGKLPTQSTKNKQKVLLNKKRQEKRRKNGGFLRIGEERVRFNEYMRKWTQKKKR